MFAPIALFVYKRPKHLQQVIEALKRNSESQQSDLIIFSDGPKSDQDKDLVRQVRSYIRTITGFQHIQIIERDKNYGLSNSIITGVTEVIEKYGKIIVLEDDLVVSAYFLDYMNKALDLYEHENKVISIHAYIYPLKQPVFQNFFLRGADCWGWGTWKRGWNLFNPDAANLIKQLDEQRLKKEFDFGESYKFYYMLNAVVNKKIDSWAIRWYASAFLSDKLTLYPKRSLIYNIGCDGSGQNCNITNQFCADLAKEAFVLERIPIQENQEMRGYYKDYFNSIKPAFLQKLNRIIHCLIN